MQLYGEPCMARYISKPTKMTGLCKKEALEDQNETNLRILRVSSWEELEADSSGWWRPRHTMGCRAGELSK